jgi:hypothetical protein
VAAGHLTQIMTTCRGGEESVATHQADMNFRKMMKDPVKKWHDEHARSSGCWTI